MTDSKDIVERLRGNTALSYAEVCRAADEITALRQRVAELEKCGRELADRAEYDMTFNQAEDSAGWWTPKTEWAIAQMRRALESKT